MLFKATKFSTWPEAGGIYDQHPGLVDRFYYILAEESKVDAEEARRKETEANKNTKGKGRFRRR